MKVAVLSDIHGNAVALEAAINDVKAHDINKIIILGDIVLKGPMPSEVVRLLQESNLEILAWVKGNTDMVFEEMTEDFKPSSTQEIDTLEYYKYAKARLKKSDINFIKKLPLQCCIVLNGIKILCIHGTPHSIVEAIDDTFSKKAIKNTVKEISEDVVLCPNSHKDTLEQVNHKRIFNVGSIGYSLDGDNRISYGILSFQNNELKMTTRRISYNTDEIIEIARRRDFPYLNEYKKIILKASLE